MAQAKNGDTVQVHYKGELSSGEMFDTSRGGDPIRFTLGAEEVISGFETAIIGMSVGESKRVVVPISEAYGPHLDELMLIVPNDEIPPDVSPEIGDVYHLKHPDGPEFEAIISEVRDDGITLDANHPLAGENLTFELELVAID